MVTFLAIWPCHSAAVRQNARMMIDSGSNDFINGRSVLRACVPLYLASCLYCIDQSKKIRLPSFLHSCRATFYDHPFMGSCGYGKLDPPYTFGYDAVAALPDVSALYEKK